MQRQGGGGGHGSPDEIRRGIDAMAARVNALEVSASDDWQRGVAKVLRALVEGQAHAHGEFGHHKKAMDLLLLEIFKARDGGGRPPQGRPGEDGTGA